MELPILTMTGTSPRCVWQAPAYMFSDSIYMTFFKKTNYGDGKPVSSRQGWAPGGSVNGAAREAGRRGWLPRVPAAGPGLRRAAYAEKRPVQPCTARTVFFQVLIHFL